MTGKIRIIGGLFKGKHLPVLEHPSLRPTPNRIRETLFNWLMHDIQNAYCLDAFAGSGALGCEALSRGANSVVLLEKDLRLYVHLKKTLTSLEKKGLTLIHTDAIHYLETTSNQFDIVFLDPPFQSSLLPDCIHQLTTRPVLKPQGLLYVESAESLLLDEIRWQEIHYKKTGKVYYGLFQKR